jgi:biotin carboxyl carrier protein
LAEAISELNKAKMERQRQEFTWMSQQQQQQQSLLVRQQQNEQQWQFQKSMILNSIQEIEEKLEDVTAVKSPYSGKVRRVKVVSQNERNINVEISLIAE